MSRRRSTGLNTVIPAEIGAAYKKADARISIKCILLYIYKTTRVQKSVHRCFFFFFSFFCWKEYIMQIYISQLQQTVPPMGAESRGELEGLQSHFTAWFSSTGVGGGGNNNKKKKKTETFLRSPQSPLVLACPDPPAPHPTNKHTLCFSMVCCCGFFYLFIFAITTTACNSSFCFFFPPTKVYVLTKGWHIQEDMSFFNNNRLIFTCCFCFLFFLKSL